MSWFFFQPKVVETDGEIELRHNYRQKDHDGIETIYYDIYLKNGKNRIGCCDLRFGHNEELYYAGNIGYNIALAYRGHHYAAKACELLYRIARKRQMDYLIITCNPDNIASRKTIERSRGEYIETAEVPDWHWLKAQNEPVKRIYRVNL